MFTAKVTKDEASPALLGLMSALTRTEPFFKTWANSVAKQARDNARAHSKGGEFWLGIAKATRISSVSDSGATIANNHVAGAQKQFGGRIQARNKRALTIPIAPEAKGKKVSEFEGGGRKLFRLPGTSVLGYSSNGKFIGLFVLRQSVWQNPEEWWPDDAAVSAMGAKEAAWHVNKAIKK
jgi:hypothetical protein